MSTHNLCFGAKIRKKMYTPVHPQFHFIKVGCKGVFITRTCYPDGIIVKITVCSDSVCFSRMFLLLLLFMPFLGNMLTLC